MRGSACRERVPDRRRREQRPEQMGAAALVLALSPLAVLVRADRDVLGAVVGGDFGAAAGPSLVDVRTSLTTTALPNIAASTPGRWNGKRASGRARRI